MTRILTPKRPAEAVRYVEDFAPQIGSETPMWVTIVANPPPGSTVTIDSYGIDGKTIYAIVSGGDPAPLTVTFDIVMRTVEGQQLNRQWSLYIAASGTSVDPSTTTKGQIRDMAFEEIGLAGYEFDATAEEQASALRRLDSLMAMWRGPGMNLDIGYAFPSAIGSSAPADVSGIPDFALDAVVINLALSIAPGIGKLLSTETKVRMGQSMNAVRAAFAFRPERTLPPSTLRGAGRKPYGTWNPYNGQGNG